jgi:hypothetical protein
MRVLRMVKHGCSKTEDSPVLQYKTLTVNKAIFFQMCALPSDLRLFFVIAQFVGFLVQRNLCD